MTENSIYRKISDAVFRGDSLQNVLDLCAECLHSPVRFTVFEHPEKGILSSGYPMEDYWDWKRYCLNQQGLIQPYKLFLTEQYGRRAAERPFIHDLNGLIKKRRIICITYIGTRRAGHISLPEMDIPLEDFDMDTVSFCGHMIALAWCLKEPKGSTEQQVNPLQRMLNQTEGTHAAEFPQGRYRLLLLRSCGGKAKIPMPALTESLADAYQSELYFADRMEGAVLAENSLLESDHSETREQFLRHADAACCISPVCISAAETEKWYVRMRELGTLHTAQGGDVLFIEEHLTEVLFREIADRCNPADFVPEKIRMIQEYDRKNHTELLRTLYSYILNGYNRVQTAEAMFLHENTISYRLRQIRTLFDIDTGNLCSQTSLIQGVLMEEWIKKEEDGKKQK